MLLLRDVSFNCATLTNAFARAAVVDRVTSRDLEKNFLVVSSFFPIKAHVQLCTGLLLVGPWTILWKVLRDTDGERFVATNKGCIFQGDFETREKGNQREEIYLTIETLLYVIIYPHALELFALRKDRCALQNRSDLRRITDGPPEIEFGVAKTFSITIMRLLRWKR